MAIYEAEIAEHEAELALLKAKRAEIMANLKSAADEMEPLKQIFLDSPSKSESLIVMQANMKVKICAPVGTWAIVQEILKKHFKF